MPVDSFEKKDTLLKRSKNRNREEKDKNAICQAVLKHNHNNEHS